MSQAKVREEAFKKFRKTHKGYLVDDASFNGGWDAALEAAKLEVDAKLKHFGVGGLVRCPVRDAIEALKGKQL